MVEGGEENVVDHGWVCGGVSGGFEVIVVEVDVNVAARRFTMMVVMMTM